MTRRLVVLLVLTCGPLCANLTAQAEPEHRPLRILVVNDDGYRAAGIVALVDSLLPLGEVAVVAPLEQQSGAGHAITYREPMAVMEYDNPQGVPWYAVDARPATVTRVALLALLDERPDVVVSGINRGDNVGASAWVSGTVGAAREGALHGIPAIAFSTNVGRGGDYGVAAGWAKRVLATLIEGDVLRPPLLLNVNVPSGTPVGIRVAPMSLDLGDQRYDDRVSPRGLRYLWDDWSAPDGASSAGSDLDWFLQGYVTVTPLEIDQTDRPMLGPLNTLFEGP
jgi:5'-nucleotidase